MFKSSLVVIATIAATTAAVEASLVAGAPVIVPGDNMQATVQFMGSEAGYTGQLYFLGAGWSITSLDYPATDTDLTSQGQLLFNNHTSLVGATMVLDGIFSLGQVLHFAYDVITPGYDLRTDSLSQMAQFAYDPFSGEFAVEDLILPGGDQDYNDAVFHISFAQVPAPGCLALLGLAGLCARGRRRGA